MTAAVAFLCAVLTFPAAFLRKPYRGVINDMFSVEASPATSGDGPSGGDMHDWDDPTRFTSLLVYMVRWCWCWCWCSRSCVGCSPHTAALTRRRVSAAGSLHHHPAIACPAHPLWPVHAVLRIRRRVRACVWADGGIRGAACRRGTGCLCCRGRSGLHVWCHPESVDHGDCVRTHWSAAPHGPRAAGHSHSLLHRRSVVPTLRPLLLWRPHASRPCCDPGTFSISIYDVLLQLKGLPYLPRAHGKGLYNKTAKVRHRGGSAAGPDTIIA